MQNTSDLFSASITFDDKVVNLPFGKMSSFAEFYVDFNVENTAKALRIKLTIHPKQSIVLQDLVLKKERNYSLHERIFCNGFQAASESKTFGINDKIPKLKSLFSSGFELQGDNQVKGISKGAGHFHSWTYSYIRSNDDFEFIGSLSENNAFTILQHDIKNQTLSIRKECNNLQLTHSFPILDVVILKGKEQAVFEQYCSLMGLEKSTNSALSSWASGRNFSEENILKNATIFAESEIPIDVIQIGDGYQKRVGDWLKPKDSFPNGMGKIARNIKAKGFKAGIWIAPFVCEEKSEIFQNKKGWLVKNHKGKPLRAGYHPSWKSWFYVLDFYNPEVQKHLTSLFFTITDKWRYDFIKLDFLYAVCLQPPPNKTRGQLMNDALIFLRNLAPNQILLGARVPLGSAFKTLDFCAVSTEISSKWENQKMAWLGHRERNSTLSALRSVLNRWQLNGKAFQSAPPVFTLKDSNSKLNFNQKHTLLIINALLGNLIFTSDEVDTYSAEEWSAFNSIFKWKDSKIQRVENLREGQFVIHFDHENLKWLAFCNLSKKEVPFKLKKGEIVLEPFESLILQNK